MPTFRCNKSYSGFFWSTLGRSKSYCRVLVAFSGQLLAEIKSYCRISVAFSGPRFKSYCRFLVAFSGPRLAVTNRTAQSRTSFSPTRGRNKAYCRVLLVFSGPRLAVTNRTAKSWDGRNKPRLGNTICYCQTWARKNHQHSAVRFVTAKRATKTRQCDLLRPNVGQKKPPRLGSTICGQDLARKIGNTICSG